MDERLIQELITRALAQRTLAYAPYSHFMVGAALLAKNGSIYTGCNIENAAFTPTNCAERTAIFKAVSEGVRDFDAIAIVGGRADNEDPATGGVTEYTAPCGVCRQVMCEFCVPETFLVILAKNTQDYRLYTLAELLPECFGLQSEGAK